jgi:hypothetical protein
MLTEWGRHSGAICQESLSLLRLRFVSAVPRTHSNPSGGMERYETLLAQMLAEHPDDVGVLHVMGRSQLRRHQLREVLELFTRVIARRERVASLRGAAECLHRLLDELGEFIEGNSRRESTS